MAVKIQFADKPKPGQGATLDVPDEVKADVEAAYDYLRENPTREGFATFDSKDEVNKWLAQVRSYCLHREAGALKFRQLPSKHLPDTQIRFQITADVQANGERNAKPGPVSEKGKK